MSDGSSREKGVVLRMPERRGGRGLDVLDEIDESGDLADELEAHQLDAVREALRGLSSQIRERTELAERRNASENDFDWMSLFDELRQRVSSLGMVEHSGEVDEFGMDESALQRSRSLHEFLFHSYWRVEVIGEQHVPSDPGCLFVANRSGLLPYDGMMLAHILERLQPSHPRARFLVADWLITLPFVQPYLARLGGVRACRENADRLLRSGRSVVAFPEGAKGAAKVFGDRYRLQRFGRGGVVRAAIEGGVPLVPVAVVGAEEAHPILFKSHTVARPIGLPFLPVTPTFPLLGPLGLLPLPTKWVVKFGEPIDLGEGPQDAAQDELLVSRLTEELRARVQELLDDALDMRESLWSA